MLPVFLHLCPDNRQHIPLPLVPGGHQQIGILLLSVDGLPFPGGQDGRRAADRVIDANGAVMDQHVPRLELALVIGDPLIGICWRSVSPFQNPAK